MSTQDVKPTSFNEESLEKTSNDQKQVISNNTDGTTPTEDKPSHIQIELPEKRTLEIVSDSKDIASDSRDIEVNPESTQYDTQKSGQDIEANKFPKALGLENYETQSVEDNTEPWKHEGPWYTDITKKRWFISTIIGLMIVIIIVVVPVSVAHSISQK